ncbi:MAG: alpha-L-fucosidase [Caldilineaceae bacterium]
MGGDGNLLLNVGPMPDGRIEPRQVDRLRIGAWLAKYGESIYGTCGGPFRPGEWGAATRKDNQIYVHILAWPEDTLHLPALAQPITGVDVLTGGNATVNQSDEGITIAMAANDRDPVNTLVRLSVAG